MTDEQRKQLREHLDRASAIVRSWPAWMRKVLGRIALVLVSWAALQAVATAGEARGATPRPDPDSMPTGTAIVGFTADWCPACRVQAPIWQALAARHKVIILDNTKPMPPWVRQRPRAIPHTVLLIGGRTVRTWKGVVSREAIEAAITLEETPR